MRNMIDANKSAFARLIEQLTRFSTLKVEDGIRYISSKPEEKEWIKTCEINNVLQITPDIRLIQMEFQGAKYIAMVGSSIDSSNLDSSILQESEINAGVVTVLLADNYLKLKKQTKYLAFYNNILFQHFDEDYAGHDYNEILEYVEPIQLYFLPEDSIINTHILSRSASYVYSKNPSDLILDFDPNVTDLIADLAIMGSDHISYKSILNCLFSTTYRHAFLELYRLVERLFPISYLKEFHLKSYSKLNFLDFVAELENVTSWRPKEDDAVEKNFSEARASTKSYFQNFHNSSIELKDKNPSKFFYGLRNSIVHFRANHSDHELSTEQWNMLILATLYLLDEQYSLNSSVLS